MKLAPIINSLLSNDFYKINMAQTVLHQFPTYKTRWALKCRTEGAFFIREAIDEIREQLEHYCTLRFNADELSWLKDKHPWLTEDFISHLEFWHPKMSEIEILQDVNAPCGMIIETNGTWLNTMMYEMPILSIVNEVYFAFKYGAGAKDAVFKERTLQKIADLKSGKYELGAFSEFGLRRRYSAKMQDWLVKELTIGNVPGFVGTSNMELAKKYGVKAIGTMAHEFITCIGEGNPAVNPAYANRFAMEAWVREFGTLNGIYLTDLLGDEVFLRDFNLTYATLFGGLRHDSGDPIEWGEKMIAHYKNLGIDPKTKTLLFSDSLDFARATNIYRHFKDKAKVAFGIGTFLSNDTDVPPLNLVCKVKEVNGYPACKLSNVPGKVMCADPAYVDYLRRCIDWRLAHEKEA